MLVFGVQGCLKRENWIMSETRALEQGVGCHIVLREIGNNIAKYSGFHISVM